MCPRIHAVSRYMQVDTLSETEGESNDDKEDTGIHDGNLNDNLLVHSSTQPFQDNDGYISSII